MNRVLSTVRLCRAQTSSRLRNQQTCPLQPSLPLSCPSRHFSSSSMCATAAVHSNVQSPKNHASFTSVDPQEVAKFAAASQEWWNPTGEFEMLHRMNPVRVGYIAEIVSSLRHKANHGRVLQGMDVLDIGCGGGLLSESLARLGASVTGADAAAENIAMATHHASLDPSLTSDLLRYTHTTAEALAQTGAKFDMITALEIIEHVSNPGEFVKTLSSLLKPNGILFVSTMNRTQLSYLLTIFLAERVLRWVPNGTHDWEKYVKPEELVAWMGNAGCRVWDQKGLAFNPLLNSWKLVDPAMGGLEVNYILTAVKSR